MLTFGPRLEQRSWLWESLRRIVFNTAPALARPPGGVGHLLGPFVLAPNVETELFAVTCVSFWGQFAIDYADGRNTDILSALIQTDAEVQGVLTHEISQSAEDIDYHGHVDGDGVVHVSATVTAPATIRGNVVYVPL